MKKFIIFITSIFFISIIIVILFRDFIVKKTFETILSNNLDRKVEINSFNVGYLSGEININKIEISNKKFPGKLLVVDKAFAGLDAMSFYDDVIIIDKIILDGISVNYFSDISNKTNNNFNTLKETFKNRSRQANKKESRKFVVKELDIKNIDITATSSKLDITKKLKLTDMNFVNLGNTKSSKNYEILAKEILDIAYEEIKDKISAGAVDEEVIRDKIKEQLRKKFKKLLK